jgi:hypothetical protein
MFMAAERLSGMASFLCAQLLDFAASERRHDDSTATPSCGPDDCPGLGHLTELARAAAPDASDGAERLLRRFGSALFPTLLRRYPSFFVGIGSTRELLQAFESHLGGEIGKLAPHLALPSLALDRGRDRAIAFSCRFPDGVPEIWSLVEGLVTGSVAHFGEPLVVTSTLPGDGSPGSARFVIAPRSRAAVASGLSSAAAAFRAPTGSRLRRG